MLLLLQVLQLVLDFLNREGGCRSPMGHVTVHPILEEPLDFDENLLKISKLREEAKIEPIRKEGVNEAKWALLDYGDLIVNIFQPEIRKFYDLESFWSNGDNLTFP